MEGRTQVRGWRGVASTWLLALAGVAPFFLVDAALAWSCPPGFADTHAVQYDIPYYAANGRAVFERGNGLAGPNPYDPDPAAPSIYFQWLVWGLGLGVHTLGLDPGRLLAAVGFAGAVVFSRLTLALVERLGAPARVRAPLFLLAMWGAGVAVATELFRSAIHPDRPSFSLLQFEPMGGWWMLSWGRNAVLPTEAVYHALMAGAWLAALGRRWRTCLACLVLVATTHPFSGLQALAIFGPWAVLGRFWPGGDRVPSWFVVAVAALAATFLGYYLAFLPRFPQHAALQDHWALDWSETPAQTVAAYALVAVAALAGLARDRFRLGLDRLLLLMIAAVSFGLSHHHWLARPRQPLHFTHAPLPHRRAGPERRPCVGVAATRPPGPRRGDRRHRQRRQHRLDRD